MLKILFVCMGNICRSPAAEAVMKSFVRSEKLDDKIFIDSAGTIGYHEGQEADPRMKEHAKKRNYELTHIARQIRKIDFDNFDYIITMDEENYSNVISLTNDQEKTKKVFKMTSFCRYYTATEVPDPYYGGFEGFEFVIDLLEDACYGLLKKIKNDHPELQ
ncbi:MAG: phosphotyrosine protein phosphatase [Ignavibacteriales bacterium CG_4_9_14_3_um_filter_34_10]|nr:MAG: phosphotyrosine protein phosphatase [Ignavibacteriales bacterium CG_4_9_14_3_um_filter_34_10]